MREKHITVLKQETNFTFINNGQLPQICQLVMYLKLEAFNFMTVPILEYLFL